MTQVNLKNMGNHITGFYDNLINSREANWSFIRLVMLGVLIRFLVMPFFCHLDFLSEYRRIHIQFVEHNLFPGSRFIVTLVEMLNYILALPFLGDVDSMFYLAAGADTTASHQDFFNFVSHPEVIPALFFLKVGYLVFDILSGLLIYRYFDNKKQGLKAAAVWFLNPITIFSFYIFGRYESIALFFLLLSLTSHKQGRPILSYVSFCLCIWSREIFVLVLPIYLLSLLLDQRFSLRNKLIGITSIVFVFACVTNKLPAMLGMESVLAGAYGSMAGQSQMLQIISFNISWYYPIIITYMLLLFYVYTSEENIHQRLTKALLGFFLSFFLFSVHSIHYVAWLFPTLCLFIPQKQHMTIGVVGFVISWLAYWTIATDLGVFTTWLAAPMSTHFLNFPNIPVLLAEILPNYTTLKVGHLVAMTKSVNAACIIFIAYRLFVPFQSEIKN